MSVDLNLPGLVDLRNPVAGDSYGWAGLEPTAAKKELTFHHSGSDSAAEDGFSIAEYHVNHNGWGGAGYHLCITRSDYPGRPGLTSPGAQIQYIGDLGTWRAHVLNQNPGRVGICLIGITPDEGQLRLARQLVDYFIARNNVLPSINFYSQVTVHRLVPDQSTSCPGDDYGNWLPYLQGGAEPASWAPPAAPTPEPTPEPGMGNGQPQADTIPVTVVPEYESTWIPMAESRTIQQEGAYALDVTTVTHLTDVAVGTVVNIGGYFNFEGVRYARSQWATDNNKWNGIDVSFFNDPSVTPLPVTIVPPESTVTDKDFKEATVPEIPKQPKPSWIAFFKDVWAQLIAHIIKRKGL